MTGIGAREAMRIGVHRLLMRCGIDTRKRRADRIVLEKIIFPELIRDTRMQSILFVGCAWYTLHYPRIFRNKDFYTLEIDPAAAAFGSASHIVGSCESIASHFSKGQLDCIVFNGVFGFGLNEPEGLDRTLRGMHHALRPGGLLVFGWNDLPSTAPFPPDSVSGWHDFDAAVFAPLGTHCHVSGGNNGHRYQFFLNRADADAR